MRFNAGSRTGRPSLTLIRCKPRSRAGVFSARSPTRPRSSCRSIFRTPPSAWSLRTATPVSTIRSSERLHEPLLAGRHQPRPCTSGRRGRLLPSQSWQEAPMKLLSKGDGILYYSPREAMGNGAPVKAFTAIGRIADDAPIRSCYPTASSHSAAGRIISMRRMRQSRRCSKGCPFRAAEKIGALSSDAAFSGSSKPTMRQSPKPRGLAGG